MSILIGADIVQSLSNSDLFLNGNRYCWSGFAKKLNDANYLVSNLETPLTDSCSPIVKGVSSNVVIVGSSAKIIKTLN